MFKKQKKDLFSYQRIVANSISKNKTLNLPEEKKIDTDDSKNEPEINEFFLNKVRGIYDFNALKERYKDTKIYNHYCPTQESKKKIFEIIKFWWRYKGLWPYKVSKNKSRLMH